MTLEVPGGGGAGSRPEEAGLGPTRWEAVSQQVPRRDHPATVKIRTANQPTGLLWHLEPARSLGRSPSISPARDSLLVPAGQGSSQEAWGGLWGGVGRGRQEPSDGWLRWQRVWGHDCPVLALHAPASGPWSYCCRVPSRFHTCPVPCPCLCPYCFPYLPVPLSPPDFPLLELSIFREASPDNVRPSFYKVFFFFFFEPPGARI